jgi:site-specific recombinase XerD
MVTFHSIFKDDISSFLSVRKKILSDSTIEYYSCCLASFDTHLVNIGLQEKEISETVYNEWQKTITGKARTKAGKIVSIRIFFKYLHSLGIAAYMPVIPKIPDDYVPYIFSDEELSRLFDAADTIVTTKRQPNPYIKAAYPMILRLLYGCGLRVGETLALQVKEIDLKSGILTLLHTKNEKQRLVPMSPSLTDIVRQYCLAMGIIGTPDALLFPGADPERPISIQTVRNRLNVILKNLGIKLPNKKRNGRGPCHHCLRHVFVLKSFAQAQKNGRNIDDSVPFLSMYLGHDSLKETEKYLKFSSELFPNALELFEDYAGMVFPEAGYEE